MRISKLVKYSYLVTQPGLKQSTSVVFNVEGPFERYQSTGRPRIPDKACLHVDGIVENASEKLIKLKFGVFGSIGEVKFLPDKNIGKFMIHPIYTEINTAHR